MNRKNRLRSWIAVICLLVIAAIAAPQGDACSWDYPIWMIRSKSADPLYRFIRDGKAGYIDRDGKVVIEPALDYSRNQHGEFHNGLLLTNLFGDFVDVSGKVAFDNRYDMAYDFSEGLARVSEKRTGKWKWGYINTAGDFVITPRFEYALSFSDGLAAISLNDRWGYIDRAGRVVIQPQFVSAADFHEGMAIIVVEGPCNQKDDGPCGLSRVIPQSNLHPDQVPSCKYGFIDRSGNLITSTDYDSAKEFSEGLAPVQVGTKWGYIDNKGQTVIEPKFDDAQPFSEGLAVVRQGGQAGFIDRTGAFVIPAQFEYAEDFSDGLAVVGFSIISWKENKGHIDRACWYINKEGKQAIPEEFDLASSFFKGLAHVRLKSNKKDENGQSNEPGPFAYINTTGEIVFSY
jgi:hypothetical protein